MNAMVNWAVVNVTGVIWMPAVDAATTYNPGHFDVQNMRDDDDKITRESFSSWLDAHSGDFQNVTDFWAVICDNENNARYEFGWADEESEMKFSDLMCPDCDAH